MNDRGKSKEQLIEELTEMRRQVADLERSKEELKRCEESLLESEGKYRLIAENVNNGATKREDSSRELRWKTALLEAQMNSSLDGILVVDSKGQILLQNRQSIDLWKIPGPIAIGNDDEAQLRHVAEMTTNPRAFLDRIAYLYAHPDETSREEIDLKNGTVLDRYSSPVVGADGTYYGRVWTFRNITERKRAEETLRQKNSLLEALVHSSHDGILVVSEGKKILQNQRTVDLWKIPKDIAEQEDIEKQVASIAKMVKSPEDFWKRSLSLDSYSEESWHGEVELIDGTVLDRDSYPIKGADGKYYGRLWTFRDVTDRKRKEEKFREGRLQLEEAADIARIAYWEHDEATGEFIFNDAFYRLFGTTAEQEGGYRMAREEYRKRFVHPDDLEELQRQADMNRSRPRTDEPEQYEHRALRRNGEVMHVLVRNRAVFDPKGQVLKVVGVNQDITERKKMEEALQESEAKLRAILESSRDAIGVSKDGIRVFANPAYVALFGYESSDELIGKPTVELIAPESRALVMEMIRKRAAGEPIPPVHEAICLRKDGTKFVAEATISNYVSKGEHFRLVTMRDVTERKRLAEQLRQAQKMEAVGTLAGGVAHDFNNILTVIMGFANLMQMSVGKSEILRPHIDQIVASSERAADLTQSLLAFSRKQRIALKPHRVNEVVESTAKLLTRLLPEDINLATDLTTEDAFAMLDVTQIGQVLMNLSVNARDAMPHGGSLTITTGLANIDDDFIKNHGFGHAGEYVKLSVSDSGIGMDAATMERIFEPFFTTKEVGKGTGLGLASAYGIVKQHNGYITVSSLPFEGTTFDIYLPFFKAPSTGEAQGKEEIKGGSETILIVEDDRDVRRLIKEILKSCGYATIEAVDGDDAVRAYREHGEHIDLVILDVVMPGKNGKEVLDEIARLDPRVKAIFVSGYTGDVVIDKGIQSENTDFLQKPLSVQALLMKVRKVLDR